MHWFNFITTSVRALHWCCTPTLLPADVEDEWWMTKVKCGKTKYSWSLPWEPVVCICLGDVNVKILLQKDLSPALCSLHLFLCVHALFSGLKFTDVLSVFWTVIVLYHGVYLKNPANRHFKLIDSFDLLCVSASSFLTFSHCPQPPTSPGMMWKLVNNCKQLRCHSEECHDKACTEFNNLLQLLPFVLQT